MALGKNVITGGLAALMVMVMTAGAYAWSATATTTVNVRSGPGTQFRVVDALQRNQLVEVEHCRSNWCFVHQRSHRPSGWVSQSYLREAGYARPVPPPVYRPAPPRPPYWDDHYRPRPPHYRPPHRPRPPHHRPPRRGSEVCFDGSSGYFCFGN